MSRRNGELCLAFARDPQAEFVLQSFTKVIAAPDLISMLYSGRTISGSGDVMPFISVDFAAWGDWSDEATEIRDSFKDRFMELFTNYLNGTGHPDGIKTSRNQFEERAEKQGSITNIGDRALRSVLFVRALTSSVYLPIKSQSNPHPFVIRFTPSIKGGDSAVSRHHHQSFLLRFSWMCFDVDKFFPHLLLDMGGSRHPRRWQIVAVSSNRGLQQRRKEAV